ncbi:MAG: hypothetical protein HYU77_04050 [Betaproteobacteria bacterium]|nr:hypothetical protein [Betaproteobacteria bacterium]
MVSQANPDDVILTGLPRSGTTLTCHLLNRLPGAVALHEPMNLEQLVGLDPARRMDHIAAFFSAQRASLLAHGTAAGKSVGGRSIHNSFADQASPQGLRQTIIDTFSVTVDKPLAPDFLLAIKHPNAFTALLEPLAARFRCFAVIRNPLSVLGSWNSTAVPVREGRAPFAEAFDRKLAERLAAEPDRLARQLILVSWYFEKYRTLLPDSHILRYEDIVASGGRALAPVTAGALDLHEDLQSKNRSALYDGKLIREVADRLLGGDGAWRDFYSPQQVEELSRGG